VNYRKFSWLKEISMGFDKLRPGPGTSDYRWSFYKLPGDLNGYLVLPSHVPFPGEPIEWPEPPEPEPVPPDLGGEQPDNELPPGPARPK
jgi:hypothetical protein